MWTAARLDQIPLNHSLNRQASPLSPFDTTLPWETAGFNTVKDVFERSVELIQAISTLVILRRLHGMLLKKLNASSARQDVHSAS